MSARRRSDYRDLTREPYVVASHRGHRRAMLLATMLPLVVLSAAGGWRYFQQHAPEAFLGDGQREVRELRDTLTKVSLELEVELATRGELERQVAALNDDLKRAREELAFLKSAGSNASKR
jgi:hypothetical protein